MAKDNKPVSKPKEDENRAKGAKEAQAELSAHFVGADVDTSRALEMAQRSALELKPKDAALYWALVAQVRVLEEVRDELRLLGGNNADRPNAPRRGRARDLFGLLVRAVRRR